MSLHIFSNKMVALKAPQPRACKGDQLREATGTSSELFKQWRKHSAKVRAMVQVSPQFDGWSSRQGIRLAGFPRSERCLDALNVAWAARLMSATSKQVTSDELRQGYWVNVAQSVDRRPWGGPGCLTTKGVWYSFERDFCLDGFDTLRLQGQPSDISAAGLGCGALKQLAGEAFFAPCIGNALLALYLSPYATWWREAGP